VVVPSASIGKRRRLPGLEVRPGSIKRARVEAGLSLAQVAAGEVSRTAVFLAETGKTRPTLPTIQLIAARTGKPLDYFIEATGEAGRPNVDKLRRLAAAEKFTELVQAAEQASSAAREPLDRAWAGFSVWAIPIPHSSSWKKRAQSSIRLATSGWLSSALTG